ncbi:hypothetical protein ENSA5_45030 [Enhygromyxa salina]|uniref:Protein N-terminal glutamine amidohydrolase n=1 Tax=Enhygromyxa salina TaxID=215803 RepID=A0A2S9XJS6_9BACT|nr:hypothetical protein [Enhygromyxa salina]PRP93128.1 hypothetical protein ENSA5_45030 [Enhygromyxa salina]
MSTDPAYCPYYCEENVWHLCANPRFEGCDRRVLIISNRARRVAMWGQRLCSDPELPIAWDYHVILLVRQTQRGEHSPWQAWDLDSAEPSPRPASEWLDDSFRGTGLLPQQFTPRFRLVSCADYRRFLRSDRRHMRAPDGSPRATPPSWPPILGERPPGTLDDGSNLDRFFDTEDPDFLGALFSLTELRRWLATATSGPPS